MTARMTDNKKVIFLRQLSLIYDSDIFSTEGLEILKKTESDQSLKEFYSKLEENLILENNLSLSIEKSCNFFEPYELKLIELGEESGNISKILSDMADGLERKISLDEKLNSAFRYPAILAFLTLFILFLIITIIIPVYYNLVKSSGAEVTVFMEGLNSFALFLRTAYVYLIVAIVVIIFALKFGLKFSLKRFLTKKIRLKASALSFTRNLGMLIESGIDVNSVFEILGKAESNVKVKEEINRAKEIMDESGDFSKAMSSFDLFPVVLKEIIAVAISTGHLGKALKRAENMIRIDSKYFR